MKLVLYGDGSEESEACKSFLKGNAIEFEEVDVRTQEGFERMIMRTQQKHAPALEIRRSHSVCAIVGFDARRITAELGLKGKIS